MFCYGDPHVCKGQWKLDSMPWGRAKVDSHDIVIGIRCMYTRLNFSDMWFWNPSIKGQVTAFVRRRPNQLLPSLFLHPLPTVRLLQESSLRVRLAIFWTYGLGSIRPFFRKEKIAACFSCFACMDPL